MAHRHGRAIWLHGWACLEAWSGSAEVLCSEDPWQGLRSDGGEVLVGLVLRRVVGHSRGGAKLSKRDYSAEAAEVCVMSKYST